MPCFPAGDFIMCWQKTVAR